jgi:hypothetical protein
MASLLVNTFPGYVNSSATTTPMSFNVVVNDCYPTVTMGASFDRWSTTATNLVTVPYYVLPTATTTTNSTTPYYILPLETIQGAVFGNNGIVPRPFDATWEAWNENFRPYAPPLPQIITASPAALTEFQKAQIQKDELRRKARATARKTLLTLLNDRQKEQLAREEVFELRIDDRIYRVRPGNTVQQLDAVGKVLCSFCIHPYPAEGWIPEDDHAIAQKLLLEADENLFLRLANRRNYA